MSDFETVTFYDRAAERAGALSADGPPEPALARFMAALAPGADVLDLGCGAGTAAAKLTRAGFNVTGIDASRGLLDVARRLAPDARFIHAGFDDLVDIAAYDGVWANFALVHAPRPQLPRHLAAIARALRPGGVLYLSMLLGQGDVRDAHRRAYTYCGPSELRRLLAAAGFEERDAVTGEKSGLDGQQPFIALLMRSPA